MVGEGERAGRGGRLRRLLPLETGRAGPGARGRGTRAVVVVLLQPALRRLADVVQFRLQIERFNQDPI
jgi:hypothetical protein